MLSIDVSQSPARAVVVRTGGGAIEVLESHAIHFELSPDEDSESPDGSDGLEDLATHSRRSETAPPGSIQFSELGSRLRHPWTSAVVVLPPVDYLSLNLELPFEDERTLQRVIDSEVQDLVPFDVSGFLLQSRIVGSLKEGVSDVHVSAIRRDLVRAVLRQCQQGGIEPAILTTPSSALGALFFLHPERPLENCAVVYSQGPLLCIAIYWEGKLRTERAVPSLDPASRLSALKLSLLATERRYGSHVARIYLVGSTLDPHQVSAALQRPVTPVEYDHDGSTIAILASVYGQEETRGSILTNFRVREFSFNPHLRKVLQAGRKLLPWSALFLTVIAATLASVYFTRQWEIRTLEEEVSSRIRQAIPHLKASPGEEIKGLQAENRSIDRQLKDLGSASKVTPVQVLAHISRDFPVASDTVVKSVKISGSGLEIEGSAPDYSAVERIERILRTKRSLYCRVKKSLGSSLGTQGDKRSFSFDVRLCE